MDAAEFWSLKRTTAPKKLFEQIVPNLPVPLPPVTVPLPVNVHVLGPGGGVWASQLVDGVNVVTPGPADNAICQVALHKKHLREIVGGALRDRGVTVMSRLGRAGQLPNLSRVPLDPARAVSVQKLTGSVALNVRDRELGDTYRYVFTFGNAAPDYDTATTTVTIDADEAVEWIVNKVHPKQLLKARGVRIEGDLSLPVKALQALLDGV